MTCYKPLKGFVIGTKPNGKKDLKIVSFDVDHLIKVSSGYQGVVNKNIHSKHLTDDVYEYVQIPCGQCIGCRIKYSKDWATRMMCELPYHDCACFITLTYNDEHLPLVESVDESTGEIVPRATLVKRDLQLFTKRLCKHFGYRKIRYYAVGEYGDKSSRPHYHAIIFGEDFAKDRYQYATSIDGFAYYRSTTLEKLWPFGYSMVCDVSYTTCAYVARYVTKKRKGQEAKWYELLNIQPEFSNMSRRPGIGRQYYDEHKQDIYNRCEMFFQGMKGGIKVRPPRYFNKLFDIEYHDEYERICEENMKKSDNISSVKLKHTNLSLIELLAVEEQAKEQQVKLLRRDDV